VGALLGWFTNFLAVKMLFHPKDPKKILGVTFQGIFPKRQKMIAMKIGKVVSDELLSIEDIKERVVTEESMSKIYDTVEVKMDNFLENKVQKKFPLVSLFATRKLKMEIRDEMLAEVRLQLPDMMNSYIRHFEDNLDIEEMIAEKFSLLSSDRLEQVMNEILSKEFKFIEILGGIIGFIVGLGQAGMMLFFSYSGWM
jgi:uncharacterized membrane protein YheB (UPF0754 family)